MANMVYAGASYTNPLRILPSGVHKLESSTDYSLAYRVLTTSDSAPAVDTAEPQLRLEWRPEGDVIGARFSVFVADANGANKVYMGEVIYGRRTPTVPTFAVATSLTSAKTRNRCQGQVMTAPSNGEDPPRWPINLLWDNASTVRLYIVPGSDIGCIVTAAELAIPA